jgi:hypothetical protein
MISQRNSILKFEDNMMLPHKMTWRLKASHWQCSGGFTLTCHKTLTSPPCPNGLRGLLSWSWPTCNRLVRLKRTWGAVTSYRWCEWWYVGRWSTRTELKPKSANYPHHGHHGNLPLSRKNSQVRTGNRTRDLVISSRRSWSLDHEDRHACLITRCFICCFSAEGLCRGMLIPLKKRRLLYLKAQSVPRCKHFSSRL